MGGTLAARPPNRDPARVASRVGSDNGWVAGEGTGMRARLVTWLLVAVTLALLAPTAGRADVSVNVNIGAPPPPAIVVPAPPALVIVPGVPTVQYAPALQVDLFFFDHRWYYPHGGFWYVGPSYRGPWRPIVVEKLPHAILAVPVKYYKVPPGHLKKLERGGPGGPGKGKGKGHD